MHMEADGIALFLRELKMADLFQDPDGTLAVSVDVLRIPVVGRADVVEDRCQDSAALRNLPTMSQRVITGFQRMLRKSALIMVVPVASRREKIAPVEISDRILDPLPARGPQAVDDFSFDFGVRHG